MSSLTESGDNSVVLSEIIVMVGKNGAVLLPSMNETITVSIEDTMSNTFW